MEASGLENRRARQAWGSIPQGSACIKKRKHGWSAKIVVKHYAS